MRTAMRLSWVLFLTVVIAGRAARLFAREAEPPGQRVLIGLRPRPSCRWRRMRADVIGQAGGIVYAAFDLIPVVSACREFRRLRDRGDVVAILRRLILLSSLWPKAANPRGLGTASPDASD